MGMKRFVYPDLRLRLQMEYMRQRRIQLQKSAEAWSALITQLDGNWGEEVARKKEMLS